MQSQGQPCRAVHATNPVGVCPQCPLAPLWPQTEWHFFPSEILFPMEADKLSPYDVLQWQTERTSHEIPKPMDSAVCPCKLTCTAVQELHPALSHMEMWSSVTHCNWSLIITFVVKNFGGCCPPTHHLGVHLCCVQSFSHQNPKTDGIEPSCMNSHWNPKFWEMEFLCNTIFELCLFLFLSSRLSPPSCVCTAWFGMQSTMVTEKRYRRESRDGLPLN